MLFSSGGYRSTFFRTSAERGQWKSDPASVFKLTQPQQPLLQTRRSAPTQSRVTTPTLSKPRLVSEPAINPSPLAVDTSLKVTQAQDRTDRTTTTAASQEIPSPSELSPHSSQEGVDSSHTMPSLVSDRASSPGMDDLDLDGPLSPLPPSSPPLSPISYGAPHSRSMSVVSLSEPEDPESPFMRSSSPLSELSDDDDDDFELGGKTDMTGGLPLPLPVDQDHASDNCDVCILSSPYPVFFSLTHFLSIRSCHFISWGCDISENLFLNRR
ncbi:hypothetical protein BJ165DRAFT_1002933 [Panaeolus papilionaceus]|nr:hypothetical protein BJ165DRAFT_1002933 [Panaeolus papilionaceus]